MVRKLILLLSLIFSLALTTAAVAQTPPAQSPVDALNEIASDVTIYSRSFEGDLSSTPEADAGMPLTAIVQVYEVDSADVAEEAFPHVEQLMKEELEPIVGQSLETEEVDDVGDMASLSTAVIEQGGMSVGVALFLVQQDEAIYLAATVVMNDDAENLATDVMEFMLDAESGDTDDVEYNEDGTSTGGYFDVFPTEDDTDVVQGLEATSDMYDSTN